MHVKTTRGLVLVAFLSGAVGGAAAGALVVGRPAATPALTEPVTEEVELRRELESVRQQLAGLQRALQAHEAREQQERLAAVPAPPATPPPPEREAPAMAASRSGSPGELGAAAAAQFSRETRDTAWSPYMERQLEASVKELPASGSSLKSVDCMATLCRVVFAHASQDERGDFLFSLPRLAPFQTELRYVPEDGDVLTTTVYVTRPGSQLPAQP